MLGKYSGSTPGAEGEQPRGMLPPQSAVYHDVAARPGSWGLSSRTWAVHQISQLASALLYCCNTGQNVHDFCDWYDVPLMLQKQSPASAIGQDSTPAHARQDGQHLRASSMRFFSNSRFAS